MSSVERKLVGDKVTVQRLSKKRVSEKFKEDPGLHLLLCSLLVPCLRVLQKTSISSRTPCMAGRG